MDFVNKNFSGTFKIIIAIAAMFVFIKILPLLLIVGLIAWTGFKGVRYFKARAHKKVNKHEKMDVSTNIDGNGDPFDFTGKNVVDVEYEEIRK
ncbi:hypothetical protein [Clostridium magnum]|uniref:DUF4834 domain-containing protein n=1 Tax=Clostridium magnum DSM 2767 TaxID=1121326 RepID=A0A161WW82_9CLOT|nr:hypothetical protein [Clostridium magnum]KZL91228.1 hypothetical protein CLMAG_29860 [Clostridium magnum DSM 2767]SHI33592.1 hypothetical protein SAMN02745944_04143 [Clostridium magnum DSM 2767]